MVQWERTSGPTSSPGTPSLLSSCGRATDAINGALALLGQLAVKGFGAAALFYMTRLESLVQRLVILMKAMRRLVASML
jgi:hypothetical protein